MQNKSGRVVILGTGGTIAGKAAQAGDNVGYTAGQLTVADLLTSVPALKDWPLQLEQVAQLDSKDMSHAVWQQLAQRVQAHLDDPEVAGIVITHGTDTLEETAWLLHRVLMPTKPVVLTAAMRPATSLQPDGPQNLLDAVTLAAQPGVQGVLAMLAGAVYDAAGVRKWHPYRIDAFSGGDDGPVARLVEGQLLPLRPWPTGMALGVDVLQGDVAHWPKVAVVTSHAGLDAELLQAQLTAWQALGLAGVVFEGTGNGTLHVAIENAAAALKAAGREVLRTSRCQGGSVVGAPAGALPSAGELGPGKARVELLLRALKRRSA
ncbi:MAG: L-asparaginase [Burkholderiales bacterium PBB6]|nr:MAG: L-asparaginase [Burkholderiales bacterium PBB6]